MYVVWVTPYYFVGPYAYNEAVRIAYQYAVKGHHVTVDPYVEL